MAIISSELLQQMDCPECGEQALTFAAAGAVPRGQVTLPAPNIICPDCGREFLQESPKLQDQRKRILSGLRTVEVRTDLRSLQLEMEKIEKRAEERRGK